MRVNTYAIQCRLDNTRCSRPCVESHSVRPAAPWYGLVPYQRTSQFVWANSVKTADFGTYQEISWYMSFFSSQYVRLRFARAKMRRRACKRRERGKRDERRAREREGATGVP